MADLGGRWGWADMEKDVDLQTFSAEIWDNFGIFWIVEDNSPLFTEETLHIVDIFY